MYKLCRTGKCLLRVCCLSIRGLCEEEEAVSVLQAADQRAGERVSVQHLHQQRQTHAAVPPAPPDRSVRPRCLISVIQSHSNKSFRLQVLQDWAQAHGDHFAPAGLRSGWIWWLLLCSHVSVVFAVSRQVKIWFQNRRMKEKKLKRERLQYYTGYQLFWWPDEGGGSKRRSCFFFCVLHKLWRLSSPASQHWIIPVMSAGDEGSDRTHPEPPDTQQLLCSICCLSLRKHSDLCSFLIWTLWSHVAYSKEITSSSSLPQALMSS